MQPWVIVAGGFHRRGGMDRLNWALANHLSGNGYPVHLVCHSLEAGLAATAASVKLVPRPRGSFMLGSVRLAHASQKVCRRIPSARVIVNGGNSSWPDVNWVHCVHHAWPCSDHGAPLWFRIKNRLSHRWACSQERNALLRARAIIANSQRTRTELGKHLHIPWERIHTVYPGSDPHFAPASPDTRRAARARLNAGKMRLVCFVGALGHDANKGFDVLFSAWARLCARRDWDAHLVAAGGGRAVDHWRRRIRAAGLEGRITMLGFTDRVCELLAAADLLVSPARYEAYGLNVHEAICCGVPAMVTRGAGVAERYPKDLQPLLIDDPQNAEALAAKLLRWRMSMEYWRDKVQPFSQALRKWTLDDMAEEIVRICTATSNTDLESAQCS